MSRTIEDIQKDIELLGIRGGYDIEQLLTPQDCRRLSYEIERLKELCDKYEEEHKTTFETWQKDIKENKKLHSIIKEVREYIDYYGITPEQNDDVMVRHILKGILKILDKGSDK